MSTPPLGTVTFLFTDIDGSTRLLQQLGDQYPRLLAAYNRILRDAAQATHGHEVDTQGDSFLFAFARAADAVLAATIAQRAIYNLRLTIDPGGAAGKSEIVNLKVRMGIHTGEPQWTGDRYVGLDLHRVWATTGDATESAPPREVQALVEARSAARAARDFARADALRTEVEAVGWDVVDGPDGSTVRRRVSPDG